MPEIQLIVFDWDGTLSDSADRIVTAVSDAAIETGLPPRPDQEIRDIIGLGLRDSYTTLFPESGTDVFDAFAAAYRRAYLSAEQSTARLFPGAIETLMALREVTTLAVATGKSREGLDRELLETATGGFFEITRCADETRPKPDPQMLREILEHTGADAASTLMIGDTDHDIRMAHNAGVAAVGVSCGAQLTERLAAAGPAVILGSVCELTDWLNSR